MRTLVVLLAAFTTALPAAAQCTAYQGYGASSATTIALYAGTGWGSNPPPISSAISMWRNACIGMPGRDFPYLSTGTSGDMAIPVSLVSGLNPIDGAGCARFEPEEGANGVLTGGTIFIYQKDNAGNDCLWVMPHATLDNLIAHELGHVLGLANVTSPECTDYIMGNDWPYASIQSDECEYVDDAWDLPNESDDPPADDPTCLPGCTTPIILSLQGDYRLTSADGGVLFDIDADGAAEWVAWTERESGLAFLVMDRNENGWIDDGSELFGNHTMLASGVHAAHGFAALDELDINRDGVVDAQDPAWSKLSLWFDRDHDGQSASELVPIFATDVIAIGTHYRWSGRKDRHGNAFRYKGDLVLTNGVRKYYDVYLRTSAQ